MNDGAGPRATVYLAVALAAAAGGLVRLALAATLPDGVWPWATLLANALGCLAIGGYWRVAGPRGRWARSPVGRTAVMTGFCGGLTTFSMFGAETWALAARGDWPTATVYVVATLVLSVGAVAVTASGDDRVS